jgi:hypothetical protein
MCHGDVSMVIWNHQSLPHVTHFRHFRVNPWTNEEVPHGRLYGMWQDEMVVDYASGWCGPMVGYHMTVGKFPMRARN